MKKTSLFFRPFTFFLLTLSFPVEVSHASSSYRTPPSKKKSIDQVLKPYDDFLSRIKTLSASVQQFNPNGTTVKGMLYIQKSEKNGKMRLNYENGFQLLSDGEYLIHYDTRKRSGDTVSLKNTPLEFLLKNGKIGELAQVMQVFLEPNQTRIVVCSKRDPSAGVITLYFFTKNSKPKALTQWVLKEGSGKITSVFLSNSLYDKKLDPTLFKTEREVLKK